MTTHLDAFKAMHLRARRLWLATGLTLPVPATQASSDTPPDARPDIRPFPGDAPEFRAVDAGRELAFPRDFGAHPGFRIEWWYLTGWLNTIGSPDRPDTPIGFQATFFRLRTPYPNGNPSRFAPTDLLAAHAALMDPTIGRPLKAEMLVNAGGAGVVLSRTDTRAAAGGWSLARDERDRYLSRIRTRDFAWDLILDHRHAPAIWLQGERGYSRKGPEASQASHYYSRPQLAPLGRISVGGRDREVSGIAWFDHEWSSTLLARDASGWDWAGLNLHDGRSIVWFVMRGDRGGIARAESREPADRRAATKAVDDDGAAVPAIWTYAALREPDGRARLLEPTPPRVLRRWRSPLTGAEYPIAIALTLRDHRDSPGEDLTIELDPLMPDQEIDSRASTGNVYWEGAVRVRDGSRREIGLGYLELTGYHRPIRF